MSIAENLHVIQQELPEHVTLVAVSKTKPTQDIQEAYNSGQRVFGENKIQEMASKWELLPKDIEWHMIGHVQRNKVKYMAEFVSLIHGVDNFKLLKEINKQALKHNRIISCLFQIKIAQEDTKFGMNESEVKSIIESEEFKSLKNIKIIGLMGMASFTDNTNQISNEFSILNQTYTSLKHYKAENYNLKILSMGMSGDYPTAIKHGSNMVRIGSKIFGVRNYNIS